MKRVLHKNSSFGRHRGPRKALIRGLVHSLVASERIKTTQAKAKSIRPLIEKAITIGKKGDVSARRLLFARYPNKKTVDKIVNTLSPRFKDRPGGYTRIIKLGFRSGDKAPIVYIEFVDYNPDKSKMLKTNVKSSKKEVAETSKKEKSAKKDATEKEKTTKSKKLANLNKKEKKKFIANIDKRRKKARLKQKQSRKINR